MSVPAPVPLDPPPGDPAALAEAVSAVTGAAFRTGVLTAHLAGPAASAPGWLGADAAAAAAQVGTVAGVVRDLHDSLTVAADRLRVHAGVLEEALRRVAALRRAQEEDFAALGARVAALGDPGRAVLADLDPGSPVVEDLTAAEAARRRAHAAVLAEVAQDAAATAGVLAGATSGFGGRGAPGEEARVRAHLAALLPGWGEAELVALGRSAAEALLDCSPAGLLAALADYGPLLDAPAFAAALLDGVGGERFTTFVQWVALAEPPAPAVLLARLVGAALQATGAAGEAVDRVLEVPLGAAVGAVTAVGLGRLAGAGGLPAGYLSRVAARLTEAEAATWSLRRDELAVAPGEDPLAAVLGALARAGDADGAARLLTRPGLWPPLLGRVWTEGLDELSALIRLAGGGAAAEAVTGVALRAIGSTVDVLVASTTTGAPEVFAVAGISGAVADLVAAHLSVVSGTVAVGLGLPGVPSRPFDEPALLLLAGLGMVGRDPQARVTILTALTRATSEAAVPAPGDTDPVAYVEGGVFAALAFGEAQEIRHQLYEAVAREAADSLSWTVITAPLGYLPVRRGLTLLREGVSQASAFLGPGGVPWETLLREPETGAHQAAFAVVAARAAPLVAVGLLPDPGSALDRGLGSPEARRYEADLEPGARRVWDGLVLTAEDGYLDVGEALGILPGAAGPSGGR